MLPKNDYPRCGTVLDALLPPCVVVLARGVKIAAASLLLRHRLEGTAVSLLPTWEPANIEAETLREQLTGFLLPNLDNEAVAAQARRLREGGFRPHGFAPF